MGTFGTKILENDTSGEVYEKFYELLNNNKKVSEIVEFLNEEFIEYKNGKHSKTDYLFSLGLALWENCSLNDEILSKIEEYIIDDIKIWEELDANEKDIKLRKKELTKYFKKISTKRKKPIVKKKKNIIYRPPIFKIGNCLTFKLKNGNYSGAIVVGENKNDTHEIGSNVIISTNINQEEKPTVEDFLNSNVLILNFKHYKNYALIATYPSNGFKKIDFEIEVVNNIKIESEITNYFRKNSTGNSNWNFLKSDIENEINRDCIRRKVRELSIKDILINLEIRKTYNTDKSSGF